MRLQQVIELHEIYSHENDFTNELAEELSVLGLGDFEDVETQSSVGTRRADIVARGEAGTLVVEVQFGKADWDHWGRLEGYAQFNNATVAALLAEDFEDLMIDTCRSRNEDGEIGWHLIQAGANSHRELFFCHRDVSAPRPSYTNNQNLYTEFWEPIRSDRHNLFSGVPVSVSQVYKTNNGVELTLGINVSDCYIRLRFRLERRDEVMELFSESEYDYRYSETERKAIMRFPVLNQGIEDRSAWPQMRDRLVGMGTEIYNKLSSL